MDIFVMQNHRRRSISKDTQYLGRVPVSPPKDVLNQIEALGLENRSIGVVTPNSDEKEIGQAFRPKGVSEPGRRYYRSSVPSVLYSEQYL